MAHESRPSAPGGTGTGPAAGGSFVPEPILSPRQQVERQLKRAILSGGFAQGERLPSETRLAEQLSVSRATVREALRALVASGLLTKSPGPAGGSFVEVVDHHRLATALSDRLANTMELGGISYDEVAAFRNLLEVPSARLAATNRTEAHLKDLREIIEREKNAQVDDPQVPELNVQFHVALAEAGGNRVLSACVAAVHAVAHPLAFIDTSAEVGRDSVRHHIAIVSAVRERDPEAAAAAMERHLAYLRSHAA